MNPVLWFSRNRRVGAPLMVLLAVLGTAGVWLGTNLHAETNQKSTGSKEGGNELFRYMGSLSCDGSGCHGSRKVMPKFSIRQNEFYLWDWNAPTAESKNDLGHSMAYKNLQTPDSLRIAKNLGIKSPEKDPLCLACHAVSVDENRRGKNYDVSEGVTCEGCHGPAEKWLGPHAARDWDKAKGASFGMLDTKNLVKRTELCLQCHLGTEAYPVDHELIGAGHPRLKFEMNIASNAMPPHWLRFKDEIEVFDQKQLKHKFEESNWYGARNWVIGQAVALRHQLELLASSRKSQALLWPDLTHFDCYACHHEVVDQLRDIPEGEKKLQRWRLKDYSGAKPGRLVWNAASYTIFRHAVKEIAPEKAGAFDDLVSKFHGSLTGKAPVAEFEQVLAQLQQLSRDLVGIAEKHPFTQKEVWSIMRRISGDASGIANAGFQSAEQAWFAITSLKESYEQMAGPLPNGKAIDAAIKQLESDLVSGRTYSLVQFTQHLSAVRKLMEPESPPVSKAGAPMQKPVS